MRRFWAGGAAALVIFALAGALGAEADDGKAEVRAAQVKDRIAEGGYYYSAGQFDKAQAAADEALKLDPNSAAAKQLKEMCAEAQKRRAAELTPTEGERNRQATVDAIVRRMQAERDVVVLPARRDAPAARAQRAEPKDEAAQAIEDNREINATLDAARVSVDFTRQPLKDAAAFLATSSKLNVQVDPRARVGEAAAPDAEITFHAKDLTVRQALSWVTRLSGLAWTVRDGVVFITDAEHLEEFKVTAVYDVRDIIEPVSDYSSVPDFDMTLPAINARRISDGFYRVPQWWLFRGQTPWTGAYFVDYAAERRPWMTEEDVRRLIEEVVSAPEK